MRFGTVRFGTAPSTRFLKTDKLLASGQVFNIYGRSNGRFLGNFPWSGLASHTPDNGPHDKKI